MKIKGEMRIRNEHAKVFLGFGSGKDSGADPTNALVLRLPASWSSFPCTTQKQIKFRFGIEKRNKYSRARCM